MKSPWQKTLPEIPKKLLDEFPARIAERYSVLPLAKEEGVLKVLAPENFTHQAREELRILLGVELEFISASRSEIEEWIAKAYGVGASVIEELTQEREKLDESLDFEFIDQDGKEATITKLVNELLLDSLKERATDIHIEPFEKSFRIRYRVDGLLKEARVSERIRVLVPSIVSRVKIMAGLDIGEKRLPQDGRIRVRRKNEELDLRVSILPSASAEAVAIRILKPLEILNLEDLGFDEVALAKIRSQLRKPHGMILVTGPTGSGKTTTLYACLRELNSVERKIITIEDPIEYKLRGVIQLQVNPKIGFTFAKALRSMLRHDPDCLMVGEIRDPETAEVAIRAALTGHLVLSTLHTNDAPSAVTRLHEMGIEPYLVSSSLAAVIAQRLVRRSCVPCEKCDGSGYYGRTAIYEFMELEESLRETRSRNGMESLLDEGKKKVEKGLTTEEELRRVLLT